MYQRNLTLSHLYVLFLVNNLILIHTYVVGWVTYMECLYLLESDRSPESHEDRVHRIDIYPNDLANP